MSKPSKILKYPKQLECGFLDKSQHYDVLEIPKEEWLKLIHFNIDEIHLMSKEEIQRKIAALRSIEGAPHFCFNWEQKDDPEFQQFVKSVFDDLLNGHARWKIFELEKHLEKCLR